ncbi:hypothetical protein IWQ61_010196 [Dispira simplex]|nr:hypothetical protein IWQ61_010196 [Dispira simplex]
MGEKRKSHLSKNRSGNNSSAAYQGRSAEKTDDIRKKGIELAVESKLQPDVSGLVSKVVGFKDLGRYEGIAKTVEELILSFKKHSSRKNKAKGLDPRKQPPCESANNWFKPNPKGRRKDGSERDLYPSIIDYIFLISMVIAEFRREPRGMAIQRRILPHRECDVRCDAEANIRYDIVLRCCDSQVDVEQEYGTFKDDSKLSDEEYKPSKEHRKSERTPTEEEEMDKFRKRIKEAFGVIEVKKSATEDGKPTTYAQLGWYIRCALDAQFDRNSMWGITVCGPLVRFVLFTHSTVIPSLPIDMRTSKGRKQFVDDYIRLSLCPKYRVGYDPTKTWLPRYKRWEVECFNTNQTNNEQRAKGPCKSVYVGPEPITSGGYLFGRRTRCHLASLSKRGELTFVLKESWTEVDGEINTVEVPNEVRIFKHIEEVDRTLTNPLTEKGIPKMKFGGAVCIRKEDVHGDTGRTGQWCYDTMSHYCGELKVVTDRSPSASQEESAESEYPDEPKEWVERVHQRLLLTPAGKPMTTLHPYDTEPEVPTELPPEKASDFNRDVRGFFKQLFLIIFILHRKYHIYHRDLSEGNVLVVENMPDPDKPDKTEKNPVPLLIDFDHARLKNDDVVDQMLSRTGTLPFMSILNLAGHTNHLTFIDECESFLYLFVWKCIIGFARCQLSLPETTKLMKTVTGKNSTSHTLLSKGVAGGSKGKAALDPAKANPVERGEAQRVQGRALHPPIKKKVVHHWVSNQSIEAIEDAKRLHMHSRDTFTLVLKALRPEFRRLEDFFHDLRDTLFTWEGGSGAIITKAKKTKAKATTGPTHPRTGHTDPDIMLDIFHQLRMGRLPEKNNNNTTESTFEMHDPLLERAKHEEAVTENFLAVMLSE